MSFTGGLICMSQPMQSFWGRGYSIRTILLSLLFTDHVTVGNKLVVTPHRYSSSSSFIIWILYGSMLFIRVTEFSGHFLRKTNQRCFGFSKDCVFYQRFWSSGPPVLLLFPTLLRFSEKMSILSFPISGKFKCISFRKETIYK